MKKTMLKFAMVFILAITLVSCYPGDDVSVKDLDTTSTFYKKSDFTTPPKSAILNWHVEQLKGEDGDDYDYNGELDSDILNTTLDNLVKLYGVENVYIFTKENTPFPKPNNSEVKVIKFGGIVPDVDAGVLPAIVLRKNTSVGIVYPPCVPGWWYWYCYPPVVGVSEYGVGTVIIAMDNGLSSNPSMSWTALMRGLLSSSSNSSRTVDGINQAFKQSPYLK